MNTPDHSPVTGVELRNGMRHIPAVVTVVTIGDSSGLKGITIGSFVSLSLDPPLVSFNVQKSATIFDRLTRAEHYAIHVLREGQAEISERFSDPQLTGEEQFEGLTYRIDENGVPVLDNPLVTFYCSRHEILQGGDHIILVGRVEKIGEGTPGRPVVYHQRAYHAVGERVADRS